MATVREIAFRISTQAGSRFTGPMGGVNRSLEALIGKLKGVEQHSMRAARGQNMLGGAIKSAVGFAAAYISIEGIKNAYIGVTKAVDDDIRSMQRLQTLMGNVPGTTKKGMQAILDYATASMQYTTLGHDITEYGASQLATFRIHEKSIRKLLPAMQDLFVGQNGVNVSQDQAFKTANLLGKVYMGQAGALRRAGISFSKEQEKVLKTGNEAEKTAMLIKVLEENYGGLARAMAKTPEGRIVQLRNAWDEVQESIGRRVLPYTEKLVAFLGAHLPQAQDTIQRGIDGISDWVKANRSLLLRLWDTMKRLFEAAKPGLRWLLNDGFPRLIRFTTGLLDVSQKTINWLMDHWDQLRWVIIPVGGAIVAAKVAWEGFILFQGIKTAFTSLKTLTGLLWGIVVKEGQATAGAGTMWAAIAGPVGIGAAIGTAGYLGIEKAANTRDLYQSLRTYYTGPNIEEAAMKRYGKSWGQLGMKERNALTQQMLAPAATAVAKRKNIVGYGKGNAIGPLVPQGGGAIHAPQRRGVLDYLPGHAAGGLVTRPHLAMVGEGGPELILPLSRAGGAITVNQTITVNGGGDPQATARAVATQSKDALKRALQELMRDERRLSYAG